MFEWALLSAEYNPTNAERISLGGNFRHESVRCRLKCPFDCDRFRFVVAFEMMLPFVVVVPVVCCSFRTINVILPLCKHC